MKHLKCNKCNGENVHLMESYGVDEFFAGSFSLSEIDNYFLKCGDCGCTDFFEFTPIDSKVTTFAYQFFYFKFKQLKDSGNIPCDFSLTNAHKSLSELWLSIQSIAQDRVLDNSKSAYPLDVRTLQLKSLKALVECLEETHEKAKNFLNGVEVLETFRKTKNEILSDIANFIKDMRTEEFNKLYFSTDHDKYEKISQLEVVKLADSNIKQYLDLHKVRIIHDYMGERYSLKYFNGVHFVVESISRKYISLSLDVTNKTLSELVDVIYIY